MILVESVGGDCPLPTGAPGLVLKTEAVVDKDTVLIIASTKLGESGVVADALTEEEEVTEDELVPGGGAVTITGKLSGLLLVQPGITFGPGTHSRELIISVVLLLSVDLVPVEELIGVVMGLIRVTVALGFDVAG